MRGYYYKQTDKSPDLWTVGCSHDGVWYADSDHDDRNDASQRVHYLNGGTTPHVIITKEQQDKLDTLKRCVQESYNDMKHYEHWFDETVRRYEAADTKYTELLYKINYSDATTHGN